MSDTVGEGDVVLMAADAPLVEREDGGEIVDIVISVIKFKN